MIRPYPRNPARALATAFALVMLGLVTVSLTAAAVLLRVDARRTASLRSDAQLRQLLLAGTTTVVTESKDWSDGGTATSKTWRITLPSDPRLQSARLDMRLGPAPRGTLNVHLTATLDGRQAEEDLQLHRVGNRWELASAQLGALAAIEKRAGNVNP